MAKIMVNPQSLYDTADQISEYISLHKKAMQYISSEFNALSTIEIGPEFTLLQEKWALANSARSTSESMLAKLKSYELFLRNCAKNYEIAQDNASVRSSRI